MATLNSLLTACRYRADDLLPQADQQTRHWENWLKPLTAEAPTGEDPGGGLC